MRPLLFIVGFLMVLYLIGSVTGGGKIGLIYSIALIGSYVPYLSSHYTITQTYDILYWVYVIATVMILIFSITTSPDKRR